jgi:hypothetical protein
MKIKDFSKYDVVFCDSLEALRFANKNGLSSDAIVKTSSPAVLSSALYNTYRVDCKWNIEKFKEFDKLMSDFIQDVYEEIKRNEELTEYAHSVARFSWGINLFLYKASCIDKEDLTERRLVIDVEDDKGILNPPWKKLLSNNQKSDWISVELKHKPQKNINSTRIPIFDKVRIAGFESIVYKFIIGIYNFYPKYLSKGEIAVASDNELIVEACYELIKRRYKIKPIRPKKVSLEISRTTFSQIKKAINTTVSKYINNMVHGDLVDVCVSHYFDNLKKHLDQYTSMNNGFLSVIDSYANKTDVIFMNAPSSNKGIALYNACSGNIPLVSAQHGVTDEICGSCKPGEVAMEINASDVFLAYNDEETQVSEKSIFKKGKGFSVGMSLRHLRMKHSPVFFRYKEPIVYISTNLYKGNGGMGGYLTDYEKFIDEKNFIENVLAKLPHKVLYKTYPEQKIRYADMDPIFDIIKKYKNITLFEKKIDMRYLMMRHRVIITSKATSSLSWAMMSLKPLVFINSNTNSPLTYNSYNSFKKGVFLFDKDHPDFYRNITELLSYPIEKIESMWEDKALYRDDTIRRFITKYRGKAGKRSADIVENHILNRRTSLNINKRQNDKKV